MSARFSAPDQNSKLGATIRPRGRRRMTRFPPPYSTLEISSQRARRSPKSLRTVIPVSSAVMRLDMKSIPAPEPPNNVRHTNGPSHEPSQARHATVIPAIKAAEPNAVNIDVLTDSVEI